MNRGYAGQTLLGIFAHPDDETIRMGGTICKYTDGGGRVVIVTATNGNLGHFTMPPSELAETRKKELESAMSVAGAESVWLGWNDTTVSDDRQSLYEIIRQIRRVNPSVIITHHPADTHADHEALSRLVRRAASLACVPGLVTGSKPSANLPPLYYCGTDSGKGDIGSVVYVDVTDEEDKKREMLKCYASQCVFLTEYEGISPFARMETMDSFYAQQTDWPGCKYAEVFQPCVQLPIRPVDRL